ncbi:related to ariadne-2 protein [Rhynchosporium agropyri]|uniref:RBR-type E3 ubiquitin transferase n=1 Tax=Rhynchosporium agropyri TaxID=914238 RepID=A0A1E1LG77_9HELO|nr:related to ariadne-2 protein [Rhynchosporium agropyri]
MSLLTRTQSADMQPALPSEYSDADYVTAVLQLEASQTEAIFDETLAKEAEGLGIIISRPSTPLDGQNTYNSVCGSADTVLSHHRTASSVSHGSASTGMTSRSSNEQLDGSIPTQHHARKRISGRRSLSFTEYEKYLTLQTSTIPLPPPLPAEPAPSLFSVSTRKSYVSIKNGIKSRFRLRRVKSAADDMNSCICCCDEFKKSSALQTLPCGHNYCDACLHVLITQAGNDESKMPPRCCTRAIPKTVIKTVLTKEEQNIFMKNVLQFSTPWESRIFCPNHTCGEFIPKRNRIDPKHPFEIVCRNCRTKACSICKGSAHAFGQDCPSDWELDAVLQIGEKSGWRRCYKCRNLVELTHGCSHITCRCKAQFCYICGAVWDPVVGCPNYCNGEEELERRRAEEEARMAEEEAEKAAKEEAEKLATAARLEAEKRTSQSPELKALRARQVDEQQRFLAFERRMKWVMWTRHGQSKIDTLEKYDELLQKMKERHHRTSAHLEDRQVAAEMELRASLKQQERSVQIRLRHMEAYCDGLGLSASGENPSRVVTERDLRELGQQYNVRDDLDRLHQSKVNVMRDKQAKQMEQLLVRQEEELEKLGNKQRDELDALDSGFVGDEDVFLNVFEERRRRLRRRWTLAEEIERKRLGLMKNVSFAPMPEVEWPDVEPKQEQGLEAVNE